MRGWSAVGNIFVSLQTLLSGKHWKVLVGETTALCLLDKTTKESMPNILPTKMGTHMHRGVSLCIIQ